MKVNSILIMLVGFFLMIMFGACGDGGVQLADKVKLTVDDEAETVELQIFLNEGVEVNVDGEIPIEEYGSITFAPAGYDSPASIIIKGNYGSFGGGLLGQAGKATTLPNGGHFPAAVVPPLYFLNLSELGNQNRSGETQGFTPLFYFSADKYVQVGLALLIDVLGEKFPAGLVLSQNFRDKQGRAVASISIFGPKKDSYDNIEVPGGLYIHGNFGDLSSQQEIPTEPIVIGTNPNAMVKSAMMMKRSSGWSSEIDFFTNALEDPFKTGPKNIFETLDLEKRVRKVMRDLH